MQACRRAYARARLCTGPRVHVHVLLVYVRIVAIRLWNAMRMRIR